MCKCNYISAALQAGANFEKSKYDLSSLSWKITTTPTPWRKKQFAAIFFVHEHNKRRSLLPKLYSLFTIHNINLVPATEYLLSTWAVSIQCIKPVAFIRTRYSYSVEYWKCIRFSCRHKSYITHVCNATKLVHEHEWSIILTSSTFISRFSVWIIV